MANICSNTFYANSEDPKNIQAIKEFFDSWGDADVDYDDDSVDVYFESRWVFPEEEMKKLFDSLPNKDDIYMRCLSVEYGCDYVAYWKCNENGWYQQSL